MVSCKVSSLAECGRTQLIQYSGFIASCVRLSILFQTNAMTDTGVTAIAWTIWTLTEPANYVIAACLPTLRPVLTRILPEKMFILSKSRDTSNKPYSSRRLKISWPKGHSAPKLTLLSRDPMSHMTGPWDPKLKTYDSRSHTDMDTNSMRSVGWGKGERGRVMTEEV